MATTFIERWLAEDGAIEVVYVEETGRYEARGASGLVFSHLELTEVRLRLLGARDGAGPVAAPPSGIDVAG